MRIVSPNGLNLDYGGKKLVFDAPVPPPPPPPPEDVVKINTSYYHFKKFGNRYWTTENLHEYLTKDPDFDPNNPDVVKSSKASRWINGIDDPTNVGMSYFSSKIAKGGSYSLVRQELLSWLPEGWRLPTQEDVKDLFDNTSVADMFDENKFNVKLCGFSKNYETSNYATVNVGKQSIYFIDNRLSGSKYTIFYFEKNYRYNVFKQSTQYTCCIRLCKDV